MRAAITAVVPNHNYGRYVECAVSSLLNQEGGGPQAVVVVDDGSTEPESVRALARLEQVENVEVIRQANAGAAAARNAGLARATTPLVLCLDADDRLAPGALERLRTALGDHPEAGFAYGHIAFFEQMEGVMRLPEFDALQLLDRHVIGPSALVRTELLRDIGGYDPAFALYEDWELWVNALAHGWSGIRVDAVTHEYRRHGEGKLGRDRRAYRAFRRQLRAKHGQLFARRAELAATSSMGVLQRAVYRFFWGPRPVPATVEEMLHRLLFSPARS